MTRPTARLCLAALVVLAPACTGSGAGSPAPTATTVLPAPAETLPSVDDLGDRWTKEELDGGADGRAPYEQTVVDCVAGRVGPVAAEGIGTAFVETQEDGLYGMVLPVALRFSDGRAAEEAMTYLRGPDFPHCLDEEGRRDGRNLPYAGVTHRGVEQDRAVNLGGAPAAVAESLWVGLRFLTREKGKPNSVYQGFLALRRGPLVQLSRFSGTTQEGADEATQALMRVMGRDADP